MNENVIEPDPREDTGAASEVATETKESASPPELSEEPEKSENSVLLRLRLPDGKTLKRRFLKDQTIEEVHKYVDYELFHAGITLDKYQLVVTVPPPRMAYTNLTQTLQAAELYHKSNR